MYNWKKPSRVRGVLNEIGPCSRRAARLRHAAQHAKNKKNIKNGQNTIKTVCDDHRLIWIDFFFWRATCRAQAWGTPIALGISLRTSLRRHTTYPFLQQMRTVACRSFPTWWESPRDCRKPCGTRSSALSSERAQTPERQTADRRRGDPANQGTLQWVGS